METVYITKERIKLLKREKRLHERLESVCRCSISLQDDSIAVSGTPVDEYIAKNVIFAFGRGFSIDDATLLLNENFYFTYIDLKEELGSEKRAKRIKGRIIGEGGRCKTYIERVSQAKISFYGDTVSFIGTIDQINEAETAIKTLIEGGTHKLAYLRMEAAHRKHRAGAASPIF
ncbi:MAG: hypothetical protein M1528_01280 [Candidatus Marsarchaeota archaeon]|nr:hypothetical protein [Candidatus Marsarchaeota archaeon]